MADFNDFINKYSSQFKTAENEKIIFFEILKNYDEIFKVIKYTKTLKDISKKFYGEWDEGFGCYIYGNDNEGFPDYYGWLNHKTTNYINKNITYICDYLHISEECQHLLKDHYLLIDNLFESYYFVQCYENPRYIIAKSQIEANRSCTKKSK